MSDAGKLARGMLAATHPAPAAMVTLFALALALRVEPEVGRALLVTVTVGAGQLSIGWSNDWLDAARDRQVGRLDKPTVRGAVTAATLRTGAFVAAAVSVVLGFAAGAGAGLANLGVLLGGWTYNLWFKRTALSWLPYAVAFGLLPVFVVAAAGDGRSAPGWMVLAGALLGVGAHVANVLPDLEDDRATGVHGLPHRLGRRGASVVAPLVLAAGCLVTMAGPPGGPSAATVGLTAVAGLLAVAAGALGLLRPRSRAPFLLSMAVAALCVVQIVVAGAAVTG
ncbi:4-hydroxybenzoate polyprenyltransferase [Isoptericola sp. CG 20/1183]|uniref:4-hydroxybenzoate polyprenyltransferase n=1 Tax=Isoptericola halotolerans TaxID=300560 RepID=A0ABX5EJ42_9MICO|nr:MULTISPECIES: UbiA family prenyltransferase [Isoptericola]PRZ09706.1 4-hydroxybenzoate polyprenyltransferase [Isoptericola sp. CG 20/1183]PRZ10507.1 4-hydroxybenzoate polyprenyltransferase [Isoptericola halotolerans]